MTITFEKYQELETAIHRAESNALEQGKIFYVYFDTKTGEVEITDVELPTSFTFIKIFSAWDFKGDYKRAYDHYIRDDNYGLRARYQLDDTLACYRIQVGKMLPELRRRFEGIKKFVDGIALVIDGMDLLEVTDKDKDWNSDAQNYYDFYDNALEIYYDDEVIKNCDDREKVITHVREQIEGLEEWFDPEENDECLIGEYKNILRVLGAKVGQISSVYV